MNSRTDCGKIELPPHFESHEEVDTAASLQSQNCAMSHPLLEPLNRPVSAEQRTGEVLLTYSFLALPATEHDT